MITKHQSKIYPSITAIPEKNRYQTSRKYHYKGNGIDIVVPRFFVFDGASIPRLFWMSTGTPYSPKYIRAGLVHDYIYRTNCYSKNKADEIFRLMLKDDGVGWYTRNKMYRAVKHFGGKAYKKGREFRLKEEMVKRVKVVGK